MHKNEIFDKAHRNRAVIFFIICLVILIGSELLASLIQRDFGRVEVNNVSYKNFNGIPIRAKILKPAGATYEKPMPGVVYIHGYQNNRETGDAYCIEFARRGFVVLNIDAIGRGNSGNPNDPEEPDFDETYGGRTSLEFLRSMDFVKPDSIGMMGHSLGAEMAYKVALKDSAVKALVVTGFAYTLEASAGNPKNMLMIIGKWDEFRIRMTGTRDIEKEWMKTPQTRKVIPVKNPEFGTTYGDFSQGTARRVFVPKITHVQESHNSEAIAEALEWMKSALHPPEEYWINSKQQIWPIKEWATLTAMLACFASLLPLGLLLIRTNFFASIQGPFSGEYFCPTKSFLKYAGINAFLIWLYLPMIFVLFGIHVYLVRIDGLFPMMMVNGIVWWFFWVNVIGFFIFLRWFRRRPKGEGPTLDELGVSYRKERFSLDKSQISKTIILAAILFCFAYFTEHLLESVFIVDFRFVFPFASDLPPQRALISLRYFPFLLIGFVLMGIYIHGQLRRPQKETWLKTYISWSVSNTLVFVIPIILFLMVQYVPLFATGFIPLVGPGGMFTSFTLNLFHIIGVLIMVIPISTWFYQITGKIYLGAFLNAALVTWMFISSQVIAPIPV
jgi:pimeloyl-ACP methyl ester carboxylesterase